LAVQNDMGGTGIGRVKLRWRVSPEIIEKPLGKAVMFTPGGALSLK